MTKKRYSSAADTIFLLSDGVPFGPNFLTNRDAIVDTLRERNRHLKMRIHTISPGRRHGNAAVPVPDLLANGGQMKDVLKE